MSATSWKCTACTLENDISNATCSACNAARPSQYNAAANALSSTISSITEEANDEEGLPTFPWELPVCKRAEKDEPKKCQHPGSTVEFSWRNRVHHCRSCGQVFCDTYSSKKFDVPGLSNGTAERVCDTCYDLHSSGTKHNVWRYTMLLEHEEDLSDSKNINYKGLAKAFESMRNT